MTALFRLGIDVTSAVDPRPTGVARYIRRLVAALRALDDPPEVILYHRARRRRRGDPTALFPDLEIRSLTWRVGQDLHAFHGPDARLPFSVRCAAAVTVHDLSAFERTDHATPRFLRRKRRQIGDAIRRADAVITHSPCVADEIATRFPGASSRVGSIPLAAAIPATFESTTRTLERRPVRLLVVGGPSVRKRSARIGPLLRYWRATLQWQPSIDWVGSGSDEAAADLIAELDAESASRVRFLGHVSDAELDALYGSSDGLLQLSDTEGFAMPLVEAAVRDCPVLSIDAPVLRETIGSDGAFFFDDDLGASSAAFRRFLELGERQCAVSFAREHVRPWSWTETARRTFERLRQLAESH
ncbi:MAG: glycosyltransferase family 4 protein [Planctomycetes bacterium]|nr:glycosyltransferase family 4 protein [Planctomycetota bacterium]